MPDLVIDELVVRNHGTYKRTQIDAQQLVVGLDGVGVDKLLHCNIGQEVEKFLDAVDDRMVDWHLASGHLTKVTLDVGQLADQSSQPQQLVGDPLRQRARGLVLDIPEDGKLGRIREHETNLSRCSTPTSSASSAPISLPRCSNVFVGGVPS